MNKNNSHMKTIVRTLACLGVLGLMASCQLYEIDTQMTPEKQAASIRMVCDALPSYTVASTDASAVTFNVSANTPWTITRSSGADWCTVTPSSSSTGALISDVSVTFQDNATAQDRKVTLTIKADKVGIPVTVEITQARQGRLYVTPVAGDYSALGGPLSFNVQTNQTWEVHSSASWLTFNRESGEPDPDGRTFTIIATAAPSDVLERTATVTVKAGDDEESFDVTQKGIFDLTEISDSFLATGDTKFIKMRTDLPWKITSDKDWVDFDEHSGTGDGSLFEIEVTGYPNEGTARTANITVTAGGMDKTFEVTQNAYVQFEIVAPESTEIDPEGEEIILEVKASMAWTPSTDVETWTVTKVDDSHLKLTAPFNDIFIAKQGFVTIKSPEGMEDSVEFTQDVNFTFAGAFEIQTDGSVKLTGGTPTRVKTKGKYRYVQAELKLKECHFADKGELWFTGYAGSCNIYNQITVGGNTRTRTDGAIYKSTAFSITQDELNAMTTYGVNLLPSEENTKLKFQFLYNGAVRGEQEGDSPFNGNTDETEYWFGFWNDGTADTWYIVESCTIVPVEG